MGQHNKAVTERGSPGTIAFGALVPAAGFRWIFRDSRGQWHLREPPEDWPDKDYQAARFYEEHGPKPDLSECFYLAASTDECLQAHAEQQTEFGRLVFEPDLYLRFASERPTPSLIREFANRYGLLRYDKSRLSVPRGVALEILPAFSTQGLNRRGDTKSLYLSAERASDWMQQFEGARFLIDTWTEMQSRRDFEGMSSFLEHGFNYAMGGSLTYQVHVDPRKGQVQSSVIASSLADALDVQWGMSIAANVAHRQCSECPTWFAVHPGEGRPEKHFCSDACRMRAYRKRKARKRRKRAVR